MKHKKTHSPNRLAGLQHILVVSLLACILALAVQLRGAVVSPQTPFEAATLAYVVDGDTIDVSIRGEDVRVRLIGIDTPESVSRTEENTPEGEAASDYLKGCIRSGDTLYLEYDKERQDKYGRTLAYVWLSPDADTGSFADFCEYNLNAVICQNTYCELLSIPPNEKYRDWFAALKQ